LKEYLGCQSDDMSDGFDQKTSQQWHGAEETQICGALQYTFRHPRGSYTVSAAHITAAVRTPTGRAGGVLADVRPDDLAAIAIRSLVERAGLPPHRIDDVILGCVNQAGEDNRNVARMAVLLAGLPIEVPGQTVNRLCGSGLQAVTSAAHAIRAGEGDLFIAGGVESMTRAPYVMLKPGKAWDRSPPSVADSTVGWRFTNPRMPPEWTISLGETAERVAAAYGISRREQDEFAVESQRRAQAAIASKAFADEIVGIEIPAGDTVTRDEPPRGDVTVESLSRLRPAFVKDGTVTAGSSSGINDGAAALAVMSERSMKELGIQPLARVVSTAVAGVDPSCMGLGPVPASRKALTRAGLTAKDLDLIELNEAFAAQAIACIRDLELDPAKVNIYGGAIALGHPLGASGAKILTSLVHALRRTGGRYGLATMCIGVGQGIAMVVERSEQ
jgi:3-oxoadipyl-CoA thiolase